MNAPALKLQTRRMTATMSPQSLDEEARTFEAVIATETPIPQYGGYFSEVLICKADTVDQSRIIGAPLLDAHNRWTISAVLGRVESIRFDKRQVLAKIRIPAGPDGDKLMALIKDGMIGRFSVGYEVLAYEDTVDEDGNRLRTVTSWRPAEVSAVPIPADPSALIRSKSMDHEEDVLEQQRSAARPKKRPATVAAHDADAAERQRLRTIDDLCARHNLGADFRKRMIDEKLPELEVRAAILSELARRDNEDAGGISNISAPGGDDSLDNPAFRTRAMAAALFKRAFPKADAPKEFEAYRGFSLIEMARDCLERRGVKTFGMRPDKIARLALGQGGNFGARGVAFGAMGSGDFVATTGDAARMMLHERYKLSPPVLKTVASEMTFRDYRPHTSVRGSSGPGLQKVNEHGEIKHGTLVDSGEAITAARAAIIFGLTHQAIVNDAVGEFADLVSIAAESALSYEADTLVAALEANPNLADGNAVFSAAHANLAAAGAAPDETTLSAGRAAMRKQTGLAGERIAPVPKYFIVPTDLETTAEKLVSTIQAAKTADANVFTSLQPLVEPRLTDDAAWYLAADPQQAVSLRWGYLESEGGPIIDERLGWEIDGIEIRVRLTFGAGWSDYRPWYKNPGA